MNKLTLVMMAGLPGSGKSTLAKMLAKELNWQLVDKDKYRSDQIDQALEDGSTSEQSSRDVLKFSTLSESEKIAILDDASNMAYRLSFREIRIALLEKEQSVIFDSAALYSKTVRNILAIISNHRHVTLKVVLCIADHDLRCKRLNERKKDSKAVLYARKSQDPYSLDDYMQCFKHLPEDKLLVYTNRLPEICVEQARKYVQRRENRLYHQVIDIASNRREIYTFL